MCVIVNSVFVFSDKALSRLNPPDAKSSTYIQSLTDSLWWILKHWDDTEQVVPGLGLHNSLCYLFVTRGIYKEVSKACCVHNLKFFLTLTVASTPGCGCDPIWGLSGLKYV